jgi:hypothetical protein
MDPQAPLDARLHELARWLEVQPWNRPGSDKSWVLCCMARGASFRRELRAQGDRAGENDPER